MAATAADRCIEREPALVALALEVRRPHVGEARLQHRHHRLSALEGDDIPGKGDEIAPVALVGEMRRGRLGVTAFEG